MNTEVAPLNFLCGTETLGTSHAGWTLDQNTPGQSDRSFRAQVFFNRTFQNVPLVHLGVTGFDISDHDCARLAVTAVNVTTEGFEIVLASWLGTRIWRVDVSWLAVGT
jgi:hypothetical protein